MRRQGAGRSRPRAWSALRHADPKPLYYQFEAEHTGEFSWDHLEQGPDVWRVRIGRVAAP
ncbi:MAG TPA: DUF2249 domain-containing protein [Terrimesophilobacter sp.]|nr:DUF2249 domain-containing protein [Terrimesophilobacter sp.]